MDNWFIMIMILAVSTFTEKPIVCLTKIENSYHLGCIRYATHNNFLGKVFC